MTDSLSSAANGDAEFSDDDLNQQWDDTPTSLQLRAISTLVVGALLLWSQSRAQIDTHTQWTSWIWFQVVTNLALPLGIVWLFFAQTVRHVPYLKNQALNAWNYGWNFRGWRTDFKLALVMSGAMLPVLWFASRESSTRSFYFSYFPPQENANSLLILCASLVVWMFCWEWFFRGFLLFGVAQAFRGRVAPIVAITLQAALFGCAHFGKPTLEMWASFAGGIVLGIVAWKRKSWLAPFLTHAIIHVLWALLILKF